MVHTFLNFLRSDSGQSLPLCLRSDMAVTLGHSDCRAGRPSKNLRHNGKRRTLFQELCCRGVPKIMEAKPLKWIPQTLYFHTAFHIATDFSRTLDLTTVAFDRSRDATPRRAPVGDSASRINLSVFTRWKDKMFWKPLWKPSCPVLESRASRLRERNRPPFAGLSLVSGR